MKITFTLIMLAALALAGCTTRTITIGNASYKSSYFMTAQSVGSVTYSNNGSNASLTVTAFSTDVSAQAALLMQAAVEGAVKGAAAAAGKP